MALCWHCGANLPEKAKYCGRCGKKQEGHPSVSPLSFSDIPTKSHERDSEQIGQGMTEHERATPVLLRPELRKQLLELLRQDKYEQLDTIRRELTSEVQSRATSALSRVLFDQAFNTLLPPHGSFGNRESQQFLRAKELLSKEDAVSREKGLQLLKSLKAISAFNSRPLVEDWCLYAEALVHGLGQAVPKWQEKRKQGKASREDIWNLAVFYVGQSDYKQALDVLRTGFDAPSFDKKHISFAQLRFALYCAAKLSGKEPEANDIAVSFLRSHLNKWPEPECFLLWMLLEEQEGQCPGADHQVKRIKIWRTLYTLLDQPICIPELNKRPGERDVRSFVDQLQQLDFHETLILWLNDYSRYSGTKFESLDDEIRQALIKAYETLGEVHLAGNILYKVAQRQSSIFQRQRGSNRAIPNKALSYMRKALVELFTFYKRYNLLEKNDVFERFKWLHREVPELWNNTGEENKQLIALTRPLLEQVTPHHSEVKNASQPPEVQPTEQPTDKRRSTSHPLKVHLDSLLNPHQGNRHPEARKRVGIFVDYENVSPSGRRWGDREVGEALISYASRFGEVVCCWVSADPRNIKGWPDIEARLKRAGFKVRPPRDEPPVGKAPENVADFALINQIGIETNLDIYIIVSGDRHYYETIRSLIDNGKIVRLWASLRHPRISKKYHDLERARRSQRDFFIDDLYTVLQALGK